MKQEPDEMPVNGAGPRSQRLFMTVQVRAEDVHRGTTLRTTHVNVGGPLGEAIAGSDNHRPGA